MKFSKNLNYTLLATAALSILVSCGGGSSSDTESTNTASTGGLNDSVFDSTTETTAPTVTPFSDAAPNTLDATRLNLLGNESFVFYFNRTQGDATNGIETGFCPSFALGEESFTFTNPDGGLATDYDLPQVVTEVTYTYTKTSSNAGTLTLKGKGTGNGGESGSNSTNNIDIFVNQAQTGGTEPFEATCNITFTSSGTNVGNVIISTDLIGTSDSRNPTAKFITSTSSTNGVNFSLQDGSDLPLNFTQANAAEVERSAPSSIYPTPFSSINFLELEFNPSDVATGADSTSPSFRGFYEMRPSATSNLGLTTSENEEGLMQLTIKNLNDEPIDFDGDNISNGFFSEVRYQWSANRTNNNVGTLTLFIPTLATETYRLDFSDTTTGVFVKTQPSEGSLSGKFFITQ